MESKDKVYQRNKRYRENNRERCREIGRRYYRNHREEILQKQEEKIQKRLREDPEFAFKFKRRKDVNHIRNKDCKQAFINMYGNRCTCCKETIYEFLTLEHKNGQRGVEKKESSTVSYRKAIKEYRPDLYEILCWNCNCTKGIYGYCPHQKQNIRTDFPHDTVRIIPV